MTVGAGEPQTVPVRDGVAQVTLTVHVDAPAEVGIRLVTASGSTATVPVRVVDGADDAPSGPGDSGGGEAGPGAPGSLPRTGADTAWMGGGVLAALALLGIGVVLRRRGVRRAD